MRPAATYAYMPIERTRELQAMDNAMAQVINLARERRRRILAQREEILSAFIAKYGDLDPADCEQIVRRVDADTELFYVRKRQRFDESVGGLAP
jgi:hypothetical protein